MLGGESKVIFREVTSTIFLLLQHSMLHRMNLSSRNWEFDLGVLTRVLKPARADWRKLETYVAGDEFERYVREQLFTKGGYDLVNQTHDYEANKNDFVETSNEPDFRFRSTRSGREFLVEAKYGSDLLPV